MYEWRNKCVTEWKIYLLSVNISGLHSNYLPPSAVAWLQAGVPGKWEHQCGRTPRVTALDPWHLHPRLQALLPAWRHGGKPPHTHLQQWHCSLRPPVHFFFLRLRCIDWTCRPTDIWCATMCHKFSRAYMRKFTWEQRKCKDATNVGR